MDDTIADLGVGFGADFIKTGIYTKVRKAKLNRLVEIEKKLKNK
jgi:enolase